MWNAVRDTRENKTKLVINIVEIIHWLIRGVFFASRIVFFIGLFVFLSHYSHIAGKK